MSSRFGAYLVVVTTVLFGSFVIVGVAPADAAQSDDAIANAGLVVQTDLPSGYAPSADDSSSGSNSGGGGLGSGVEKFAKKIPSCKALSALAALEGGKGSGKGSGNVDIEGTDFENPSGDQVGSEVGVYASEGLARASLSAIRSPAMSRCFPALMKKALEVGFAAAAKKLPKSQRKLLKDIDVNVALVDGPGTDGATYRMTIKMGILPGTPLYMDVVFVRVGRAVGTYDFMAIGALPSVETTVLSAVNQRMAAAQA